jgi:hypothetical protein
MNLKKKILLGVGLLVLLVVISVPAFLMFRGISQFGSAKQELDMTVKSLRSFYKKNPFPTEANIKEEQSNLAVMQKWFNQLVNVVTAGQIEQRDSTPSSFMTQYNQTRNKIIKAANKSVKIVADDNAFGFSRYADGVLPVAVDVPRLMQQMMITERLAMILISSNVKKINKIDREKFDSVSASTKTKVTSSHRNSSRRRGSSAAHNKSASSSVARKSIRKTDIYEVQSFTLEFVAKEAVALDVINKLARDDLFIVVNGIEFTKQGPDLKSIKSGGIADEDNGEVIAEDVHLTQEDSEYPTRQMRRVSGPNVDIPMIVSVDLDVYTFFINKVKEHVQH